MKLAIGRLAVAACLALGTGANAQVPPDLAVQARAAGRTMSPASSAGYAALFPPLVWEGVTIQRDIAYGPEPKQVLDVYTPDETHNKRPRPVLLFVHGGGFRGGDKHGVFYPDNVTLWATRHGMVGINIDYRLAPQNPYPAAAQDLAAAIAWARANVVRYGGDPRRIVLFGHSAGANHVADYLGHRELRGAEAASVKGAVLLSPHFAPPGEAGPPFYAPATEPGAPHPYYGHDVALQSDQASVERLEANSVPLFVADAEFDPRQMQAYTEAMRRGLCAGKGRCPRFLRLRNHNHFTEAMALGTSDQSLSGPLLEWIRRL